MSTAALMLFLLICAVGAVVQATTGFGFGIVCMTVFPYVIAEYTQSVAVCSLCAAAMSSMVAIKCYKQAKIKIVLPLFAGFCVASVLSIKFASSQSGDLMIKALGIVLILVSIYFIFLSGKIHIRPTFLNGVIAGALGGFGSGMFGIGGPPVVIYLMSATDDKDIYRACSLTYFALGSWYASGARYINNIITADVLKLWGLAMAALVVGTYLGNKLFNRINTDTLRKLVYGLMAVSGITMLF